ncbi:MAG: MarR family transcriptional regulator [Deltaproteobacteria bacterium]|nr:MarR family transcriptional regulator [Deltaproteobacteria bacterium]
MVSGHAAHAARRSFTRLARFFDQLLRGKLTCGPLTVQQFSTLEALERGPRTMNDLASQVGLHQSTMTRIVDRLERDGFVGRERGRAEKRKVSVVLTAEGKKLYRHLDKECASFTERLLGAVPAERRASCVEALVLMSGTLDPDNEKFRTILRECCRGTKGEPT